jgi:disulfide bond formation protein DsbB
MGIILQNTDPVLKMEYDSGHSNFLMKLGLAVVLQASMTFSIIEHYRPKLMCLLIENG